MLRAALPAFLTNALPIPQLRRIGRAGLPFADSACGRCGMSQQAVERTLGKLLTDERLCERLLTARK
jgi:hypothetical protein